ncbi:acyltransferase [Haliea sp.]|jgi:acetyltransferase-like isoleucine patch superfamily enzyme|uniref:acyltransferase n=1 Tax=Haliea sp. TaxID=1932666 RepID=UPI000C56DED8|nr:acyltransferase [Haliea sp.]MAD63942.1 hypothetical protein [Haliea sp.]MAY92302.1 hypothetical protein [Haliea sp.]MBK42226.1 hypothetical protein [Haliea sp.]MBP68319.1 hypothetical protein [Haliea sp.]|tara:strand:+ start:9172 stop:9762 length:591 start_codon:yes stop_codon:yes gene_type:complete
MTKNLVAELAYQLRYAVPVWLCTLMCSFLPDAGPFIRLRGLLVSTFLPGRPRNLTLGRDVSILAINRFWIGDNVYIAKGCWFNAIGGIYIDNEVIFSPYVVMSSSNHGFKDGSVRNGGAHPAPISIGFGTWVAAHAVIAAGVKVGPGNLIAANSVVTKDTPFNVIVAGVPGRVLHARRDNPSDIISKHQVSCEKVV